jgi:hypothetical protein
MDLKMGWKSYFGEEQPKQGQNFYDLSNNILSPRRLARCGVKESAPFLKKRSKKLLLP